ncbi:MULTISPECIES: hypothetical protein [Actinosynnema]|uniref:Uncharacterized protein n=1 Tax=Actinosynnema pretiosum TaxID=42197 RepID=A0A290ZFG3_9PSEU|nr:hypothetical protein [Actinosynnema pretiosum]ATE57713.1 hypothetical protein CNX65_34055 [Actinosynnema pretiosum]
MSEAELREGLLAALGDEPPLDFDADALIRKGRQRRKRRRALAAVGTTTALLLVTALSVPLVLDRLRSGAVDSAASGLIVTGTADPGAVSAEPSPTGTSDVPPGFEELEGYSYPGAWIAYYFESVYPHYGTLTVGKPKVVEDTYAQLGTELGLAGVLVPYGTADRAGLLRVDVGGKDSPLARSCSGEHLSCRATSTLPDGTTVDVADVYAAEGVPSGLAITHHRADGTVVRVRNFVYDPVAPDQPPLDTGSYDAMHGIATDGNLKITAG